MKPRLSLLLSLGCCTIAQGIYLKPTSAQVAADGTTDTTVNSTNQTDFTITDGDRAGDNLFHSFDSFSVPNGGSAFFDNAANIANIFSRVTGGNMSNIDGLIRANGTANLFLINPAGIMFGRDARLDIGGSFLGTTADSILFEDGEFSATDLENPPLLTVNAPIGLGFRDNPKPIEVNSTASADFTDLNPSVSFDDNLFGLRVPDGKTFALAGGNITADGGGIVAVGGRIELGAVGGEGILGLNFENGIISFNFPDNLVRANVTLANKAGFLVAGNTGGDMAITASNLTLSEESGLFAGIFSGLGFEEAQGGDIFIKATDSVTLTQNSRINNRVGNSNFTATGNSGDIVIEAQNLFLKDGSAISVSTFGKGNSGNLSIKATQSVELIGESNFPGGLFAQVDTAGEGDAGNLTIDTQKLRVGDGSRITASTFGAGNAGNLTIRATNIEVFETPNKNFFRTGIFAGTFNAQRPGSLDFVAIGKGNAGNLVIETESLSLQDGGQVSVATNGVGNAGNLTIKASEFIKVIGIEDPDIFEGSLQNISKISAANEGGSGMGGSLRLETKNLEVADGGQVSVATAGIGDAGNLTIDVSDSVILRGNNSGIFAEATPEAQGRGGNITIQTNNLALSNDAQLSAVTPLGLGGNITLNIEDTLTLQNNGLISARAFNEASGGNIDINTNYIVTFPNQNNDILASAEEGQGGEINITAEALFGIEERPQNSLTNDIDASSGVGLDGTVSITTPDVNVLQNVIELPSSVVEPEQTVAQVCEADRENVARNGLIIKGKGGIPPEPTSPLDSDVILVQQQNLQAYYPDIKPIKTSIGDIMPARGIIKTESGEVILTAYPTSGDRRTPTIKANCS